MCAVLYFELLYFSSMREWKGGKNYAAIECYANSWYTTTATNRHFPREKKTAHRLGKSIFHFNDQSSKKIKHINCAMLFSQFIQASKQSSFDLPFQRFVSVRCSCVHDQFRLYIRLINEPYPVINSVELKIKWLREKNKIHITTARNTSLETKFHFI